MKTLYLHLRQSRGFIVLALIAGIISGACSTSLIALLHISLSREGVPESRLLWSFLALCVAAPVARYLSGNLLVKLGQRIMFNLRMQLARQILTAPLRRLEEVGSARLFSSFNNDIMAVTNMVVNFPILCMNLAIVIGCLVYMGWLSWSVLLIVFGFVATGVSIYRSPMRRAERTLKLARDEQDGLFKQFRALVEGNKELKLHHHRGEAFIDDSLQSAASGYRRLIVSGMRAYNAATSLSQILFFIMIGLLVFGLPLAMSVDKRILTGCVLTTLYLIGPMEQIMGMIPGFGQARIALKKVEELGLSLSFNTPAKNLDVNWAPKLGWRRLVLSGVTHAYRSETEDHLFTLGPIDLTIHPGELVFLIGGNGSGKTTLAKLLIGLYTPETGEIYLDDELITDKNREYFRQHFSVVFYDFFLFDKFLGLDTPELAVNARRYLSRLELDRKVQIRDAALSTTELSQGQRKRLALLTAYLEDRPIYLFDEWAADQDPIFKEVFYHQILPELKSRGKTVVVISHDDRYYQVADRIIKLDYGKLVQDGRSLTSGKSAP